MNLDELADLYLTHNILREASEICYRSTTKLFRKHLSQRAYEDIRQITQEELLKARREILASQRAISFNTHRKRLRTMLGFAVREKILPRNPVDQVTLVSIPERPFKTLTDDTLRAVFAYLSTEGSDTSKFWLTVTQTFYWTGMRRAQLAGLQWRDIDLCSGTILLRAENSKTGKEWQIPISDELTSFLLSFRKWTADKLKGEPHDHALVFDLPLFTGRAINPVIITGYYRKLGLKLGHKISPHRFRHTIATRLANSVPNIKIVQEILGHSSVSTTCGYILPDLSAMKKALSSLEGACDRHDGVDKTTYNRYFGEA